jgi:hypothetical protein
MEPNLWMMISAAVAGVFVKRNGNQTELPPTPPPWLADLQQLCARMESIAIHVGELVEQQMAVASLPSREISMPPELNAKLERIATAIATELSRPQEPLAWPSELAQLAQLPDKLVESLARTRTVEVVSTGMPIEMTALGEQMERISNQLGEVLEKASLKDRLRRQHAAKHTEHAGHAADEPLEQEGPPAGGGGAPRANPGPVEHASIQLDRFNTVNLVANTVYELTPPEPNIHSLNLLNLGPGTVYLRANADPSPGDQQSATVPPGALDNAIHTPSTLRVIADQDSAISVRLDYL